MEQRLAKRLPKGSVYEPETIAWEQPSKWRKYTPDWKLPNGIYVEAKGKLDLATRQKHVWLREQHPEIELVFIFERSSNTLTKSSKTTYGEWATKHGFEWIDESDKIPSHWLKATSTEGEVS